jgi:DNA-binding NtrC family response regulator
MLHGFFGSHNLSRIGYPVQDILGISNNKAMQEVLQAINRIAPSDLSVLIKGEHGTGKEWAARAIHRLSSRSGGPFWPFDCSSIPLDMIEKELFGYEAITREGIVIKRGAFEEATGGTLLLNEIDSLPTVSQLKIARALDYQNISRVGGDQVVGIDVRIIATLSQEADLIMSQGDLRKDMFFRLCRLNLELPPLRERREDIPLLIKKFLQESHVHHGKTSTEISREALELCVSYDWPGNVLHLKNAIEYASVMCPSGVIRPEDLPSYLREDRKDKKITWSFAHRTR